VSTQPDGPATIAAGQEGTKQDVPVRLRGIGRERTEPAARPLRIAMVAPPWIPVPPLGYGGTETVVSTLTEELAARGHDVTLFCAPGSVSAATVRPMLTAAHPGEIQRAVYEADHVSRAMAAIEPFEEAAAFDVVHDHSGFTLLAMADRIAVPVVHTLHGPFDAATSAFYSAHADKATLVAISATQLAAAPAGVRAAAVIANPIDARIWRLQREKSDYVLWLGRMTADKGPDRAIAAAAAAGVRLVLAGVVQPGDQAFFDREVAPHIDGERVRFVGEVSGAPKRALFAEARALLMPIGWPEPFGMVMIEALASGTPVIAFARGAARDLILDGTTGFLVDDVNEMAAAIGALPSLSPIDCRQWVLDHCDVQAVARHYEGVYATAIARARRAAIHV
jgi:glycosyltransferase involved in cell wall biosynthesis